MLECDVSSPFKAFVTFRRLPHVITRSTTKRGCWRYIEFNRSIGGDQRKLMIQVFFRRLTWFSAASIPTNIYSITNWDWRRYIGMGFLNFDGSQRKQKLEVILRHLATFSMALISAYPSTSNWECRQCTGFRLLNTAGVNVHRRF